MELPGALFSPSWKNKQNPPRENFLCPNIKNFIYIFSAALIFQETEPPPKKILMLSQKKAFLILWETEAPPKIFMFRKRYFLIFHEKELSELEKKTTHSEKMS